MTVGCEVAASMLVEVSMLCHFLSTRASRLYPQPARCSGHHYPREAGSVLPHGAACEGSKPLFWDQHFARRPRRELNQGQKPLEACSIVICVGELRLTCACFGCSLGRSAVDDDA